MARRDLTRSLRPFPDAAGLRGEDRLTVGTVTESAAGLGAAEARRRELVSLIEARYGIEPTLLSGKDGPELKYRKGGRTLLSLFPRAGGLTALVVLGAEETRRAFDLELGRNVRGVLESARQYHDGRWLFVPVTTKRDVRDVAALVALKRPPRAG